MNVEAPLPPESFPTVLAVHFLVNSFLPLVDGSYMFCHMALSGEHFVTVRTGYALHSAVFRFSHVDMSDVRAEVGLGGENPHTEMTSLVARVVCQTGYLPCELG